LQRKQNSYGANGNGGAEDKGEARAIVRETKCLRCVSRGVGGLTQIERGEKHAISLMKVKEGDGYKYSPQSCI